MHIKRQEERSRLPDKRRLVVVLLHASSSEENEILREEEEEQRIRRRRRRSKWESGRYETCRVFYDLKIALFATVLRFVIVLFFFFLHFLIIFSDYFNYAELSDVLLIVSR